MKELNFTGQRPWLFLPVTFFKGISLPHTFMTSSEQDQIPQCPNHIPPKNSFILKYDSSSRFSPNFHIKQPSMYLRSPANLDSVSSPAASSKRASYGIIQEGVGSRDWTKRGKDYLGTGGHQEQVTRSLQVFQGLSVGSWSSLETNGGHHSSWSRVPSGSSSAMSLRRASPLSWAGCSPQGSLDPPGL